MSLYRRSIEARDQRCCSLSTFDQLLNKNFSPPPPAARLMMSNIPPRVYARKFFFCVCAPIESLNSANKLIAMRVIAAAAVVSAAAEFAALTACLLLQPVSC